jgi:hypothetical protein
VAEIGHYRNDAIRSKSFCAGCGVPMVSTIPLVRLEREMAYCCAAKRYEEAITHPEECIEFGFPLRDVKMKDAAN